MSPERPMPQFHLVASNRRDPSVRDSGQRVTVIGRRAGCEVRLASHSVSELHAALVRRTDGVWLFDLGSRNGTRVNGHRVTGRRVADGDHLQFGDSRYRIHISGTAGPPVSLVRAALHNPATDRWEHLVKPITIVGRRGQSDLHLSGDQISRAHALLVRCGDGLVVHDLGSRSGTFAGGQRRHEALLTGGQTLAFGPFQFQVEVSPEEQSPQAAETGPGEPEDFLAQVLGESEGPTEKPADDFLADLLAPPQEQPPTADGPAEAPPAADADQETRPAKTRQVSAPPGPQGEPKDHPQDDFEDAIAEALAAAAAGGGPAEEPFEDLSAIEPAPLTPPESKDETEEQDPAPEKHADDSADTAGNGTRKHG